MLSTQASDVTFHGVGHTARGVRLDGLAKVGGGRVVVGQGAKAGFKDLDQVGIDFRCIVDDVAVIHMDTNEAFASGVLGVDLEEHARFQGVRRETSQGELVTEFLVKHVVRLF